MAERSVAILSSSSERLVNKSRLWLSAFWLPPNQKPINLAIYINLFLNKQMAAPTETKQACVVYSM